MRHGKHGRKLGLSAGPRRALLRRLVEALFLHGRIRTTLTRAKEIRPLAERAVTWAKKGTLHHRRQAFALVSRRDVVNRLFDHIVEWYRERNGGYTRIIKMGPRPGDAAPMALIELVDWIPGAKLPGQHFKQVKKTEEEKAQEAKEKAKQAKKEKKERKDKDKDKDKEEKPARRAKPAKIRKTAPKDPEKEKKIAERASTKRKTKQERAEARDQAKKARLEAKKNAKGEAPKPGKRAAKQTTKRDLAKASKAKKTAKRATRKSTKKTGR